MEDLQEYFGTLSAAPDRRVDRRTTPASLTQVDFGDGHGGIILNISEAGMAVAVAHVFAVGERLPHVRFQLPSIRSSIESVEISAEIVWLSESKKGAGMRFVYPSAEVRNHISNWIEAEKMAPEFEHLPKPIHRDKRPLEIRSGRSRTIFSIESIGNEDAGARYAKMFPSESAYAKVTATLDEIRREEEPPPSRAAATYSRVEDRTSRLPGEVSLVSMADVPSRLPVLFPPERNDKFAPEPLQTSDRDERENLTTKSEPQSSDSKTELSPLRLNASSSNPDPPDKSAEKGFKLQFAAFGVLLLAISFILGLTAGYAPIEKRLRSFRKPAQPIATTSPAPPAIRNEATSPAPVGNTFDTPPVEASRPNTEESQPEIKTAPSHSHSSNLATSAKSTTPSPSKTHRTGDSDGSLKTHKVESPTHPDANSKKNTGPSPSSAPAPSKNPTPPPTAESKKSKPSPEPGNKPEERNGSTRPPTESAAAPASPKSEPVVPPAMAAGSTSDPSPRDSAAFSTTPSSSPTPAPDPAPRPAPAPVPATVVIPAAENGRLVRAIFPRKSVADSPSLAITSQLSVLISPEGRFTVSDHETARLQVGGLISYVLPRQPRPADRYQSTETVKVRATIGSDGQVTDVKPMNGSIFLLSSVVSAVRQWRFHPTLLNGSPVEAQDDVTIEFRLQR
jgi:hypothetical protein